MKVVKMWVNTNLKERVEERLAYDEGVETNRDFYDGRGQALRDVLAWIEQLEHTTVPRALFDEVVGLLDMMYEATENGAPPAFLDSTVNAFNDVHNRARAYQAAHPLEGK